MNFISHFYFNHYVQDIPPTPHFVLGVTLPDLWPQLSRKRRLKWGMIEAQAPLGGRQGALRAGLLNHVAADRVFHVADCFVRWQRAVKREVAETTDVYHLLADFAAHLAVELALDHHLVRARPEVADQYYAVLGDACDARVEADVAAVGHVDASGLARLLGAFLRRRTFCGFADPEALYATARFVIGLTSLADRLTDGLVERAVDAAIRGVDPAQLWSRMPRVGPRP
jgi:hypothetical protein